MLCYYREDGAFGAPEEILQYSRHAPRTPATLSAGRMRTSATLMHAASPRSPLLTSAPDEVTRVVSSDRRSSFAAVTAIKCKIGAGPLGK